jgi:hypothetical protein
MKDAGFSKKSTTKINSNFKNVERSAVLRDIATCSAVGVHQRFRGLYRLLLHGRTVSQATPARKRQTEKQRTFWFFCLVSYSILKIEAVLYLKENQWTSERESLSPVS